MADTSRPEPHRHGRKGPILRRSSRLRRRLAVASRVLAAIGGGYALSALAATVMAIHLPTSRVEAAVAGMLASFVIYTGAVVWVFAARSAWRAWLGLLAPGVLLGGLLLLHLHAGSAT
ncbi:DUF3649 domain-containing protein [Eleftheria terrae]|uniref:DUF3649 domain-containing protein n=1 Tax=Eleftheria terrae TaxID=1597781 RepID=UPI00263BBF98|nr:DUF3649 domain-containing protein [Eleftheria terrae]WKB55603.1 DUF3649 domain-containing protein [Eleftheria terrae]